MWNVNLCLFLVMFVPLIAIMTLELTLRTRESEQPPKAQDSESGFTVSVESSVEQKEEGAVVRC